MKTIRIIALSLLLALGAASPAAADFTEQTPIDFPMLHSLDQIATEYWLKEGVVAPSSVEWYQIPDEWGVAMRGSEPGTNIYITVSTLENLHALSGRWAFCVEYIHEKGHNAGLSHESGFWIMNPATAFSYLPHACRVWAKPHLTKSV